MKKKRRSWGSERRLSAQSSALPQSEVRARTPCLTLGGSAARGRGAWETSGRLARLLDLVTRDHHFDPDYASEVLKIPLNSVAFRTVRGWTSRHGPSRRAVAERAAQPPDTTRTTVEGAIVRGGGGPRRAQRQVIVGCHEGVVAFVWCRDRSILSGRNARQRRYAVTVRRMRRRAIIAGPFQGSTLACNAGLFATYARKM